MTHINDTTTEQKFYRYSIHVFGEHRGEISVLHDGVIQIDEIPQPSCRLSDYAIDTIRDLHTIAMEHRLDTIGREFIKLHPIK